MVVAGEVKMLVESSPVWAFHFVAMRIDPKVDWWFAFAYVLCLLAEVTEAQINHVTASAVELVFDVEHFLRHVTLESFCRDDLSAALVVRSG